MIVFTNVFDGFLFFFNVLFKFFSNFPILSAPGVCVVVADGGEPLLTIVEEEGAILAGLKFLSLIVK